MNRNILVSSILLICVLILFTACVRQNGERAISFQEMEQGFQTVPASVKPSVYWYWISDNVSKEGVTRDLEAMAEEGIGRAFIGNIGLGQDQVPYGDVKLMSEEWWEITEQAIRKASEIGVDIGLFNSPGWSQSGGPWIDSDQSMRYLANAELHVTGPQSYHEKLPEPEKHFQDVAVLAFPAPENDRQTIADFNPSVTTHPRIAGASNLVDGDTTSIARFPEGISASTEVTIEISTDRPMTARSLVLYPAKIPFKAEVELQARQGNRYRTLKKFEFDRSNPRKTVGFKPFAPVAISFPAVQAAEYRLVLKNITNRGGFAEIALSAAPHVERYIEKQLAKMFQTPLPLWSAYEWSTQPEVTDEALAVNPSGVLNITDKLSEEGVLNWEVPAGEWVVLRLGMAPTGVTNGPASPEGQGLEVDKINKEPLKDHFNAFVGKVLDRMPEADRKAFKYVVADSYETGSQNWTDGFAGAFQQEFGYDPLPWLPVLTGRIVGNADQSNRFLWDLRRLVADRVAYQYVGGLRELSHQHGLKVWLENYGHWGFPAEFLQYGGQADEVAGEFWAEGDLGSIELRAASSAAHIYGKTKVAAESFTAAGKPFARYPALLKKRGDWSFTEGVNHTLLHVYIMQPYEDRNPGMNAWFGTEFNRKNTWFDQMDLFTDYLRRSMFILQQGKPVADVAYFIGEGTPKMTGIQKPKLPAGYSFDYINGEVINERLSVKDGKLILPDGVSYELLVLPELETMRPELLRKIKTLVEEGAAILGPAPKHSPSLKNYPEADDQVKQMAEELWGEVDGKSVKSAQYGRGMVMWGMDMQSALDKLGVQPDFGLSADQPVLYTHRSMGSGDIYFVTNQSDETISVSPAFRVTGKQPEFWDPVTGTTRKLPDYTERDGHTRVPLKLASFQSGFIVFRNSAASSSISSSAQNFPEPTIISQVQGPWEVTFDSARRGSKEPVLFKHLTDWSRHQNKEIKYYSGPAVYRTSLNVPEFKKGERLLLDLGRVQVMAKVKVNGKDVGGVWTAPWRIDVTDAVRQGENQLEIEVVNTWVNRLIGDSMLPADERESWAAVNPYTPESRLEPSGLIGPVTLKKVKYIYKAQAAS